MSEQDRSSTTAPATRSRRNLPLLMIGIGLLILVSNAGPLGSVLWSVVWPIALIAVGLDLISEGRQRRRIGIGALLGVIVLGPLVGGARLVDSGRARFEHMGASHAQQLALQDVDRVQARITQTAGVLSIKALSDQSEDVARVDREGQINSYTINNRTGVLEIASNGRWNFGDVDLRLTPRVPLDLTIDLAAGSAKPLDLEELQLEKLNLTLPAGEAQIKLPNRGVMDVTIAGGVGSIELDVPEDLAARIVIESGLGETEYDEDRFQNQGGVLVSDDYSEESLNRATIRIDNSGGRIEIK